VCGGGADERGCENVRAATAAQPLHARSRPRTHLGVLRARLGAQQPAGALHGRCRQRAQAVMTHIGAPVRRVRHQRRRAAQDGARAHVRQRKQPAPRAVNLARGARRASACKSRTHVCAWAPHVRACPAMSGRPLHISCHVGGAGGAAGAAVASRRRAAAPRARRASSRCIVCVHARRASSCPLSSTPAPARRPDAQQAGKYRAARGAIGARAKRKSSQRTAGVASSSDDRGVKQQAAARLLLRSLVPAVATQQRAAMSPPEQALMLRAHVPGRAGAWQVTSGAARAKHAVAQHRGAPRRPPKCGGCLLEGASRRTRRKCAERRLSAVRDV
jgi:hypothetical protein